MGKNQHSKDKLYLTRTEHASGEHRGAGKQSMARLPYKTLPFDCCAISFRPFETPLCTDDGIIFELLNVVPYLKKFRRHPVTGQPLAASDLTKLHFHRNAEGQYACPVLFKPFTQHTHIVAIKTTGNVYCYDAVKQMNLKTNDLRDLLDQMPFTRADVLHIQDPTNSERRELEHFNHVNAGLEVELKDSGGVRHNEATARIMQQVAAASASATPSEAAIKTTGAASASFTSTSVPVQTVNEIASLSAEEAARQRYVFAKAQKTKGYVQLRTSHGTLNLELRVDCAPRTCDNFLQLIERGYYDGTSFHRLIRNFMLQGGDPTGTGSGGESAWGGKFADEISGKLKHDGRGVLSMANSGPNSNGSQFFLTFKSAAHLDGKHTVFGSVVGGLDTLARIEALPTDKDDRPLEPVTLLGASIFVNPFADIDAKMDAALAEKANPGAAAAAEKAKRAAEDAEPWFNYQPERPKELRVGVGKYIAPQHFHGELAPAARQQPSSSSSAVVGAAALQASALAEAADEPPKKKPKSAGGFGSFDAW
ncbi:ubiquitin-protein pub49 [Chrysochromulina tobinii]|uniref:Ubiquitin-protein pub49 n=1 Tax=Chrysochromulina tobinii TaxID=1460289 RepID=A0A0M0JEC8_9EUKA|nr:ubiquitin-protein pub49 [Chrysochromulina tobinii]|eukprot:KOO24722.1 ubiquitin-protein pub49 [Chrysochromulina sp. CCMP291]